MFYYVDDIGVHFSAAAIQHGSISPLYLQPHVQNPSGDYLDNKSQWIEISGEYVATGNELFLTIGSFSDAADIDSYGDSGGAAYVYIDDVSVTQCSLQSVGNPNPNLSTVNVYPNPNKGNITIHVTNVPEYTFELYGMDGRLLSTLNGAGGSEQTVRLDADIAPGVYLWFIRSTDMIIDKGKLVIE